MLKCVWLHEEIWDEACHILDFEDMLGLAVHLIWDWNVAVTENVVYLKHPVPSVSHFKQIVSVPVEQMEIFEIGWALSEGISLSHELALY